MLWNPYKICMKSMWQLDFPCISSDFNSDGYYIVLPVMFI